MDRRQVTSSHLRAALRTVGPASALAMPHLLVAISTRMQKRRVARRRVTVARRRVRVARRRVRVARNTARRRVRRRVRRRARKSQKKKT